MMTTGLWGGESSTKVCETIKASSYENHYSRILNQIDNNTYGLDLSRDWTNSSVELIQTLRPSDSPILNNPSLWYDEKRNTIYHFGGEKSFAIKKVGDGLGPFDAIWGFKLNDRGNGTWSEVLGPTSVPFPNDIHGISGGINAYDSTSAYHLGGFASWETSRYYPKKQGRVLPSGLLKFNFSTLEMTNLSKYEPITNGAMFNIPSFDDNNLMIALPASQGFAFNDVSLYDKKNETWYFQTTSGDIPKQREAYCAVAIQEKGSSNFEM